MSAYVKTYRLVVMHNGDPHVLASSTDSSDLYAMIDWAKKTHNHAEKYYAVFQTTDYTGPQGLTDFWGTSAAISRIDTSLDTIARALKSLVGEMDRKQAQRAMEALGTEVNQKDKADSKKN